MTEGESGTFLDQEGLFELTPALDADDPELFGSDEEKATDSLTYNRFHGMRLACAFDGCEVEWLFDKPDLDSCWMDADHPVKLKNGNIVRRAD